MERKDLTDDQWATLAPLLPAQKPRTGRPTKDHRTVVEGILWVLRTVSSRSFRRRAAGVWDRVLAELQRQADRDGRLGWTLHSLDGTTVRAHPHAAGAKGGIQTQNRKPSAAAAAGPAPSSASAPSAGTNRWPSS